jgi:hypothetical protein
MSRQLLQVEPPARRLRAQLQRASGDQPAQLGGSQRRMAELQRSVGNSAVAELMIQRACMLEPVPEQPSPTGGPSPAQALAPPPELASAGPTQEASPPPAATKDAGTAPATTGTTTSHATVRQGSKGDEVKAAQNKLNHAGASPMLIVDGAFGPLTKAAAIKFQGDKKLWKDGVVGPKTWAALEGEVTSDDTDRSDALKKVAINVIDHGSSAAAVKVAKDIQDQEWRSLSLTNLKQLDGLTVELHVIPADKKMTDLDEFKHLKGQTTFDGRLWDDVRGINMGKDGTKIRSAAAEETLISVPGKPAGYSLGFVASHESGHAVRSSMTPAQDLALVKLFNDRVADKGQPAQGTADDPKNNDWLPPGWYTASNVDEYLAQSVAAFFSHPYSDDSADKYNPSWLIKYDNPMYLFLSQQIYAAGTG